MFCLHFAILFLAFGLHSFSELDYLENENKDFTANTSSHRIEFHEIHGKDIVLSRRGTAATRTDEGYCRTMTFTKRPVKVNERISVKILKDRSGYSGGLRIGFTGSDPLTLQPFMSECFKSLSSYEIKKTRAEKVDLMYEREKSVFSYYVDERGVVHYVQQDEDKILFNGVDTSSDLWAVLHVYGNAISIQLLGNSGGVLSVPGVEARRERGISYLMSLRNTDWGWAENTHRAIVALYLSGAMAFNGTDPEQQPMVKDLELETFLALSRNSSVPLSESELALYINALLVSCNNPRNFRGFNLIALLKEEISRNGNSADPFVHLVLCNANEAMSSHTVSFLESMLKSDSEYLFWTDFRAMAVMALACNIRRNGNSPKADWRISRAIDDFNDLQRLDGSIGNIYTTALVIQALLASDHINDPEWEVPSSVSYFLSKQNSSDGQSFGDFLATYLIVPILNEKSLVDVGQVKCPKRIGSEISVKYSLCFGKNMEIIQATSLNVPPNFTVLDVMNLVGKENPKFKFLYEMVSNKMYVYSIGNVTNDPEKGMFWLLYLSTKENEKLIFKTEGPGKISLNGGEHIIMWYKKANI